jgi:hypothetical protein
MANGQQEMCPWEKKWDKERRDRFLTPTTHHGKPVTSIMVIRTSDESRFRIEEPGGQQRRFS